MGISDYVSFQGVKLISGVQGMPKIIVASKPKTATVVPGNVTVVRGFVS